MKKKTTSDKPAPQATIPETNEKTERPALGRSGNSVRTGIRAGSGKADLVTCIAD